MTASAQRRRRSTIIGALAAVGGLAVITGTAAVGALTLADSQAGRDAGAGRSEIALPETPTGLMVAVDADGAPASLAVVVLAPEGRGGSLVPVPVSASQVVGGPGLQVLDVLPLAETWELVGPAEFVAQTAELLGLSFDFVEVVNTESLAQLFEPLGAIRLDVPELGDSVERLLSLDSGEQVTIDASRAAQILTTQSDVIANHELAPAIDAVWEAIADQIGSGFGTQSNGTDVPLSLDELVQSIFSGPVGARSLSWRLPLSEENPRAVDALLLDVGDLLLVFAQIAPNKVSAPNPSFNFRIESYFSDEQLAPYGVNNADIASELIVSLLFMQSNVISVETSNTGAPSATVGSVARDAAVETLTESWSLVFGDIELRPTDEVIAQVDVTVVLGEDYLEFREQRLGQGGQ